MTAGANKILDDDTLVAGEAYLLYNSTSSTVFVEGKEIVLDGAKGDTHEPRTGKHEKDQYVVIANTREVFANGIAVSNGNDYTDCSHIVGPGSDTVFVGD